jgi:hypothetical protein
MCFDGKLLMTRKGYNIADILPEIHKQDQSHQDV